MSNKHRYITIELDKPRKLRLTTNALCELEDKLDKPINEVLIEGASGLRTVRAFLWAGLLHEDPDLTIAEAGDLIDLKDNLPYVQQKVTEAVDSAFGWDQVKNEEGPKTKENQSGTGKK